MEHLEQHGYIEDVLTEFREGNIQRKDIIK